MAFTLGDIIIDRLQYGYTEDFSGNPLYTLTQLQDATINISAESTDAVDNTGAIVKRFWKAKTGEFTANNAMINLNIIAAGAGEGSATLAETTAFNMPKIITAKRLVILVRLLHMIRKLLIYMQKNKYLKVRFQISIRRVSDLMLMILINLNIKLSRNHQ